MNKNIFAGLKQYKYNKIKTYISHFTRQICMKTSIHPDVSEILMTFILIPIKKQALPCFQENLEEIIYKSIKHDIHMKIKRERSS